MTSKFSIDNRELLQRISSGEAVVGIDFGNLIVRELAAFRLAAMDSEPVEMPLDYLQGHKDGLEWAARLAEANHPQTGDWLYDDHIELAKAIRKGPDMPPVQPVEDSDPDRNHVLAYADSYRDMAKQGVESVPIWSVITDIERNIAPLYRHAQPVPVVSADLLHTAASAIEDLLTTKDRTGAGVWFDLPFRLRSAANAQPAPVVPDDVLKALQKVARIRLDMDGFDGDRRGIADCLCDAEEALIEVVNRRAAMLQAAPVCTCPSGDGSLSWPCPVHPGNSPAIPDGWTGNDKANAALMMLDRIETVDPVDDDRIDGIKRIVRDLAAAPQLPGSEPATVPGTWIPVSEQMPEVGDIVLTAMGGVVNVGETECSAANCRFFTSVISGRELPATHWMPLPAAPQEVK